MRKNNKITIKPITFFLLAISLSSFSKAGFVAASEALEGIKKAYNKPTFLETPQPKLSFFVVTNSIDDSNQQYFFTRDNFFHMTQEGFIQNEDGYFLMGYHRYGIVETHNKIEPLNIFSLSSYNENLVAITVYLTNCPSTDPKEIYGDKRCSFVINGLSTPKL